MDTFDGNEIGNIHTITIDLYHHNGKRKQDNNDTDHFLFRDNVELLYDKDANTKEYKEENKKILTISVTNDGKCSDKNKKENNKKQKNHNETNIIDFEKEINEYFSSI